MRAVYERDFKDFLRRHGLLWDSEADPPTIDRATAIKLRTAHSFGYEWNAFSEMRPEWEENSRFYLAPIGGTESLDGLVALDAGCGMGRHSFHALNAGARLVALDVSEAIDVARRNCSEFLDRGLWVQADLLAPPFAPDSFDLVFSVGVLHHLPDPEAGFRGLVGLLRPGGRIVIYVYHALEGERLKQGLLRAVDLVRLVTTRMPLGLLRPLTTALGYGLLVLVVSPYRVLSGIPMTRSLAEGMPLKAYARLPARVIVNDQFDRFSAPSERRYREADVRAWLARAGLSDTVVLGGHGWRALGRKPDGSTQPAF
jgi:SAM-dependent methyltransferase